MQKITIILNSLGMLAWFTLVTIWLYQLVLISLSDKTANLYHIALVCVLYTLPIYFLYRHKKKHPNATLLTFLTQTSIITEIGLFLLAGAAAVFLLM